MSSSSASPKPQQQHKSPSNFAMRPPDQQGLKCPRCDSPNTKFCYYNNYSLSQPRHFCKTCRRYWTKGGALRNVPVGGGCRKPKKSRSAIPASNPAAAAAASSAAEFQFGTMLPINQFVGFNYPIAAINGDPLMFNANVSIVSSIESLSSMNQDLHWKLQQQRLAILFAGGGGEAAAAHHESNKMIEPVSFHQAAETAANYNNNNTSEWINGVQAWADHHMPQFSALP